MVFFLLWFRIDWIEVMMIVVKDVVRYICINCGLLYLRVENM